MIELAQASAATPPVWVSVVLAVIAGLVAVGVALAPAVVEKVKRGKTADVATPKTPAADGSIDLVAKAFEDLREERDEAQAARDRIAVELAAALKSNAQKDIDLVRAEARIDRLQAELDRRRGVS